MAKITILPKTIYRFSAIPSKKYQWHLFYRMDAVNKKPTKWEKIFANEVTDKGLISKIYKQLMKLNIKKQTKNQKINQWKI